MEKKKKSKFDLFLGILGLDVLLTLGEYIIWLFGGYIIIERMISFYINFNSSVKTSIWFNLAFMFAIMSIPMFISYKMMDKIDLLPIKKEKK